MTQSLRRVVGRGGVERLDRDERGERQPDHLGVTQRDISGDDTVCLQPADTLVHRRHGKACLPGEFGEAHASVAG
jgi:hypothetical protein